MLLTIEQLSLENQHAELTDRAAERLKNLDGSRTFYEFLREGGELEEWITEQTQIAQSEDYGQDYEHIQVRFMGGYQMLNKIHSNLIQFREHVKILKERLVRDVAKIDKEKLSIYINKLLHKYIEHNTNSNLIYSAFIFRLI